MTTMELKARKMDLMELLLQLDGQKLAQVERDKKAIQIVQSINQHVSLLKQFPLMGTMEECTTAREVPISLFSRKTLQNILYGRSRLHLYSTNMEYPARS
ncbi:hypothetical protein [uncultured Parabacteroides sp.]|uniref:hypothetical protein n=1 Tax=uncultured Parabacteroides sp. TaxID=512312 RepID=UPI0028040BBF|nr:hypothetical protein [uncultured Parabacteroides sp.]